jgi:predicted AAA+ superfamily ATPase
LKNLFKETYLKDIIERNRIKSTDELEELLNILASNIGSLVNPQKLTATFKSVKRVDLSAPTIKQYLDYLQDAFLVNKVLRYNIKGKKYINTPFKCYFTDIGLRNTSLYFRQIEETHIMENIIYNELQIRGYNVDVGEVNIGGNRMTEVDFVANLGNKRYYIQSALTMPTVEKIMQEKKSLLGIRDGFKKIIITKENMLRAYQDEDGITIMSLKEFLLNKNSLDI